MKDLIIGAFEKYGISKLKPWMNSIDRCGFTGDVLLITYGDHQDTKNLINFVSSNARFIHINGVLTKSVVCDRFRDSHLFLRDNPYNFVFFTDPGDVVFQLNPSEFIRSKLKDKTILCGSESVVYKDETWGNQNMKDCYPQYYEYMKDKIIYNAGTISGKSEILCKLFLDIYKLSIQTNITNPDQAAYNLLIQSNYKLDCLFSGIEDGYAVQCGTTACPSRLLEYGNKLLEHPVLKDGVAFNSKMQKTCLLHQYHRVPGFYEEVLKLYA